MDPLSATASIGQLVVILAKSAVAVRDLYEGVREVDERTQGLRHELDAFQAQLDILREEVEQGNFLENVRGWWNHDLLHRLLSNCLSTLSALESIFLDITGKGRKRRALPQLREYYRSQECDRRVHHLRLQLQACTSSLQLPILLMNIRRDNEDSDLMTQAPAIAALSGATIAGTPLPVVPDSEPGRPVIDVAQSSNDLIDIAETLLSSLSNATETILAPNNSLRVSAEQFILVEPLGQHRNQLAYPGNPLSITGVPLSTRRQRDISSWAASVEISDAMHGLSLSTSETAGGIDSEHVLMMRCLQKAKELTNKSKFDEAIPHLLKVLEDGMTQKNIGQTEAVCEAARLTTELLLIDVFGGMATSVSSRFPLVDWGICNRCADVGMRYMASQSPEAALPFLRRSLDGLRNLRLISLQEIPKGEVSELALDMELLLCQALVDTGVSQGVIDVLDRIDNILVDESLRMSHSAHIRSKILLMNGLRDLPRAKELGVKSLKIGRQQLGENHPETYEAIRLLVALCRLSDDTEAELWSDMLPPDEKYKRIRAYRVPFSLSGKLDKTLGASPVVYFSPDLWRIVLLDQRHTDMQISEVAMSLTYTGTWRTLRTPGTQGTQLAFPMFSPNGKLIAASSHYERTFRKYRAIQIFDATTGALKQTLKCGLQRFRHDYSRIAGFSADSSKYAESSGDNVRIREVETGRILKEFFVSSQLFIPVASPNFRWLATNCFEHQVQIWDLETGKMHVALDDAPYYFSYFGRSQVAFSENGERFARGNGMDTRIWNVATGMLVQTFGGCFNLAFSPDGLSLLMLAGEGLQIWDIGTRRLTQTIQRQPSRIESAKFSRDGKKLAVAWIEDGYLRAEFLEIMDER